MADVCVYIFAEWGVVPKNVVALLVSTISGGERFVVQGVAVSTFV